MMGFRMAQKVNPNGAPTVLGTCFSYSKLFFGCLQMVCERSRPGTAAICSHCESLMSCFLDNEQLFFSIPCVG